MKVVGRVFEVCNDALGSELVLSREFSRASQGFRTTYSNEVISMELAIVLRIIGIHEGKIELKNVMCGRRHLAIATVHVGLCRAVGTICSRHGSIYVRHLQTSPGVVV